MQKDDIKKIIEEILTKTALSFDEIEVTTDDDDGSVWFLIKSSDSKLFIGKNGENLEALNHLIRKIIENKTRETRLPFQVVIDVNEYQKKKTENIKAIAHMMAERARFFKASVEVEPMNAFERKIIHTYLQNKKDVATESVGQGPTRHVVIKFVESEI